MTAIVLAGTQRVKFFIVDGDQSLAAFRLLENPVLELLTNLALLFLCSLRRLLIQHPRNASVSRRNFIPNLGRAQVQGVLRNQVGVGAVRTVGHRCFDITVTKLLVGDGPAAGIRSEFHFDHPPRVVGGIQKFLQKLLHILSGNPSSTKADADFTGFQVLGLHLFKRSHIDLKLRVICRYCLCRLQLLADVAGQVFIRRQVDRIAIGIDLYGVTEDNACKIVDDTFCGFPGQLGHIPQVNVSLLGETERQRFLCGIYMIDCLCGADRPLGEHIRLALEVSLIVQIFQGAEQEVAGILAERGCRATAVDKPIFLAVGIVLVVQTGLQHFDILIRKVFQLGIDQLTAGIPQGHQCADAG